jgi:ubiquinone/menaquinone biosynthesis C-methylase UbiE
MKMNKFNEKSKTAYNKKADDYENTFDGKFTRKFKTLLAENIALKNNQSILDVACGNGSFLALLNKQKPIKGYGVDVSDQMIKNAVDNNPDMEFHISGCENLPFEDGTMDIITVCSSYHHFPDVKSFAKETKRVLKQGGIIYIAEIYLPSFLRLLINPFVPLSKDGDVKFYSSKEIIDNFKPFGFENIDVKISGHIQIISMKKL